MNISKINEQLKKICPKRYSLIIKDISISKISFEKFHHRSVLTWCTKYCTYNRICGHCPNKINNFNKDKKKEILNFDKGLLIILKVPSKEFTGKDVIQKRSPAKSQRVLNLILLKIEKILAKKYKYLLMGGGPCKLTYCWNKQCDLINKGKCPFSKLAHPAMEGCGINVFKTAKNVGHKIYWIDNKTKPQEVPYGSRVGLVLFKSKNLLT